MFRALVQLLKKREFLSVSGDVRNEEEGDDLQDNTCREVGQLCRGMAAACA